MRRSRLIVLLAALCTVLAGLTPAQAARTPSKPTANTPYLGWSSWSLQSTKYPGVNSQGDYSWLTEQHVLQQAQVMATTLKSHGYHTRDAVYPDLRTTNGWDSSYKLSFDNPCASKWIDSIAQMFAKWGVDFLKLDGVGPGSDKSGPNYDNTATLTPHSAKLLKVSR